MSAPDSFPPDTVALEAVIATSVLDQRPARPPNTARETALLLRLMRDLALAPESFFQKLANAALELSQADSTGISLLNEAEKAFVWPAVAGPFTVYLGDGTPSDFGPCGTVLERDCTLLMHHPERHFTYLQPIQPGLEEVLLVPFYMDGKAVGTIWAVIHGTERKFDAEDRRLLESLSTFAASAYQTLAKTGSLGPLLRTKAQRQSPPDSN